MSKARDLINAHLYPILATFSVIYFAIQIAPIAQQSRHFNTCIESAPKTMKRARAVMACNGRTAILNKPSAGLSLSTAAGTNSNRR